MEIPALLRCIITLALFSIAHTNAIGADNYAHNYVANELGFISEGCLINIGKTIETLLVGINVQANKFEDYTPAIFELMKALEIMNRWPVWTLNAPRLKPLLAMKANIATKTELIKKRLRLLASYRDEKSEANFTGLHSCTLTVPSFNPQLIIGALESLHESLNDVDVNINATALETPDGIDAYTSMVYWVHHYLETISNILEIIDGRSELLDSLLSHAIPAHLNIMLQAQVCYTPNHVEGIDIRFCKQYNSGVYCEIHVVSQTKTEQAMLYEFINYEGVQLRLHTPDAKLIKQEDNSWKELKCEHSHLTHTDSEEFQQCELLPFNLICIEKLQGRNFEDILHNCNFTFADPQDISMTSKGVLLQGDSITSIKEIHPENSKTLGLIKTKLPVLITTNAYLQININHREVTVRPTRVYENRTVNYTWLNEQEILKLVRLTRLGHVIQETQYGDVIDIIYGFIFLIVIPTIMYFVRMQCHGGNAWYHNCCKRVPKRPNPAKANYKMNKRILLKTDSPITHACI